MNLTETIKAKIEAEKADEKTNKAKVEKIVEACRARNPYTRKYHNVTAQILLAKVAPDVAEELKKAAADEEGTADTFKGGDTSASNGRAAPWLDLEV